MARGSNDYFQKQHQMEMQAPLAASGSLQDDLNMSRLILRPPAMPPTPENRYFYRILSEIVDFH